MPVRGLRVRMKLLRVADSVLIGLAEMTKSWIREVFRLFQQLVLAFSAVLCPVPPRCGRGTAELL
jgi:hypothetical protein